MFSTPLRMTVQTTLPSTAALLQRWVSPASVTPPVHVEGIKAYSVTYSLQIMLTFLVANNFCPTTSNIPTSSIDAAAIKGEIFLLQLNI